MERHDDSQWQRSTDREHCALGHEAPTLLHGRESFSALAYVTGYFDIKRGLLSGGRTGSPFSATPTSRFALALRRAWHSLVGDAHR